MRTDLYKGHDYFNMDDLLTEEHKLIRDAARAWVKQEVSPIIEEAAETQVFPQHLLPGLGAIGAFGPYIPEEYGGAGLDQISYGLIMQELERCDSGLRSTASVQSSLVMYPIWKYGSEEQRMKYLPKLATGEWIGCFGLTEPDHGSNPSGMVTSYVEDGDDVILNGSKMWITNAGFADVFTVFAQVDGDKFTGFIVERDWEGMSFGAEEKKLGIKGSSTRQVFFENVKVPVENLLGEIGKGHKIAFNILNIGRIKLCAGVLGGSKMLSYFHILNMPPSLSFIVQPAAVLNPLSSPI